MGALKKYAPCIACDALKLYTASASDTSWAASRRRVPDFYDINGALHTTLLGSSYPNSYNKRDEYGANMSSFSGTKLTPIATGDSLDLFDNMDYTISPLGVTVSSNSITYGASGVDNIYSIRVTNNNPEMIYSQNTDPIWKSDIEYFVEDSENPGQYIDVTEDLEEDHSSFIDDYLDYYILVPGTIVIKCIKFKKTLYVADGQNTQDVHAYETLYCAYFLDESEWVTIPVGESRNLVIDFSAVTA